MYVNATAISRHATINAMDVHFHEHRDANPFWNWNRDADEKWWDDVGRLRLFLTGSTGMPTP